MCINYTFPVENFCHWTKALGTKRSQGGWCYQASLGVPLKFVGIFGVREHNVDTSSITPVGNKYVEPTSTTLPAPH